MHVAIVDQVGGTGGLQRFLQGLTGGLLQCRELGDADFSLVLRRPATWAVRIQSPRLRIEIMPAYTSSRITRGRQRVARALWRLSGRTGRPPDSHALARRRWTESWVHRQNPDLVYFTSPFDMPCPRLAAPLLTTFHDFNHKRFPSWTPHVRDQIDRDMRQWLVSSRIAIVSSSFIAGELRNFYPEFASAVRIIPLGVPPQAEPLLPRDWIRFKHRHGLPDRFLLTVGFLLPHKNQKVIVEALGLLKEEGRHVPLVCVGPDSHYLRRSPGRQSRGYAGEILAAAERHGLRQGVDFFGLGPVEDTELEVLYRRADALVLPTLYEAGSFPVREAIRAGCPVVCSGIPSLMEDLAMARATAQTFDPLDPRDVARALRAVLGDPSARRRAAQFRDQVDTAFDWRKTADAYATAFKEAIVSQPRPASLTSRVADASRLPTS